MAYARIWTATGAWTTNITQRYSTTVGLSTMLSVMREDKELLAAGLPPPEEWLITL
jgi:hypothetical protein